jgi:hypothetical protein
MGVVEGDGRSGSRRREEAEVDREAGVRTNMAIKLLLRADIHDVHEHLRCLLANERKGPREDVHEVGKPVWVWRMPKLLDVHGVLFIHQDGTLHMRPIK